jgi:hypothetical protein
MASNTPSSADSSSGDQFSEESITTPTDQPTLPRSQLNAARARYVVLDCLDAALPREEIRQKLMAYGYSAIEAEQMIEKVEQEQLRTREYDAAFRGNGIINMVIGGLICIIGIGVTVGSFASLGYGGGSIIIAWGAIAAGAFQFYCGLLRRNQW